MRYNTTYVITGEYKSNTVIIDKLNEVHLKIECEPVIRQELSDFFTFDVPGAKFMPAYRNRMWDGKIRLYDVNKKTIYYGLLPYIEHFCAERQYDIENNVDTYVNVHSKEDIDDWCKSVTKIPPRDYQLDSVYHCIDNNRSLIVSPTASGKSLIIYLLQKFYNSKTLIIVPTISLVHQLASDFIEYGETDEIHKILAGKEKESDSRIIISTWQSIYEMPRKYFDQFEVVVGDECHLFKAKSLTTIMHKLQNCTYRFGFTGTLDGTQTHKLVLEGLFGKVKQFVKTKELIESEHLAKFSIKCLVLEYPESERKLVCKYKYIDEMKYLISHPKRNAFIKNLCLSLKGNTLLLFQFVEDHGKILYDMIRDSRESVFFVYGGTDGETRERIRGIVEDEKDAIIIASYGTFSTGINIRNLHNIIFGSPSKSRIRNLQSIGRGLRLGKEKEEAVLYDIADDLRYKSKSNHTIKHFAQRITYYTEEEFTFKIHRIEL